MADGDKLTRAPAFDHAKLAAALSTALRRKVGPLDLPFTQFTFNNELPASSFRSRTQPACGARPPVHRRRRGAVRSRITSVSRNRGPPGGEGVADAAVAGSPVRCGPSSTSMAASRSVSPDGKREAMIRNYNVAIRTAGSREVMLLSTDGSEGGYYDPESLVWSPDSTRLAVYKVRPGQRRYVHYVESSPEDQLQPKHSLLQYAKPGDVLDVERPVLFHVETKTQIAVDTALFPNAYDMTRLDWRPRQLGGHLRVQPARASGLSRDLHRSGIGRGAGRSSPKNRRHSSATPARSSATISTTARTSSGCRSGTAGTTSTSTTARRER